MTAQARSYARSPRLFSLAHGTAHTMNSSNQLFGNTSVYSASTGPSSVFSGEDGTYEQEVREMEEYYIKTLLDDDDGAGPQVASEASSVSGSPKPHFAFELPAQAGSASTSASKGSSASTSKGSTKAASPQKQDALKRELEVKINADYVPSSDLLPLTTENLVKLSLADEKSISGARDTVHIKKTTQNSTSSKNGEEINRGLYKTELCESFTTKGSCRYGNKCQFAHGLSELKFRQFGNNFRTKPCINWTKLGYCPYGKRCCFKHGSDQDIKVYLKAGTYVANSEKEHKKNLHANVKALQKITW